jgi:hypothetical protein
VATELLPGEKKKTTMRIGIGQVGWAGSGCGLAALAGLRSGKWFLSFFFYSISFILFPVLCFAISNANLLFDFAGFELAIHLQYIEFEIS